MTREDAIQALVDKGKTRAQAEAFFALLGSAFARRGWVEGDPLSTEEVGTKLNIFLGEGV